jgi:hypothetical protein
MDPLPATDHRFCAPQTLNRPEHTSVAGRANLPFFARCSRS